MVVSNHALVDGSRNWDWLQKRIFAMINKECFNRQGFDEVGRRGLIIYNRLLRMSLISINESPMTDRTVNYYSKGWFVLLDLKFPYLQWHWVCVKDASPL